MKIKKIIFMFRRFIHDFRANKHINVNEDNTTEQLGHYYIKFNSAPEKLNKLIHSFDGQGVPVNTTYIDVSEPKLHYYPISIGQYGLAVFHTWLEKGEEKDRQHFLRIAGWFMENYTEDPLLGVYWLTDIPKPEYQVYKPWKSAFTQSRGISILLRAWQLTGKREYLDVATKALIPFTRDISENGVSVDRQIQKTFYEEYVAAKPTRVIDGHIFSLFGIYDYTRATLHEDSCRESRQLALQLFNEGIEGLAKRLPDYDMGFWLRFNKCELPDYPENDPCTIGYLRLVGTQLAILHKITRNEVLLSFSRKCKKYDSFTSIVKMLRLKFTALKQLNRL